MLKINPIILVAVSLMLSFGLQSCRSESAKTSTQNDQLTGKLILTGSSTVAPLVSEIAKQFEMENPQVRIDVQSGGSSRGIADARSGVATIGMVSRSLKQDEQDLHAFTIAKDGVGIIVNKDNPVTQLSHQQIIDIYTGKVINWEKIGGENALITVINKAEGRSTLELFLKYFKLKNSQVKASVIIGDNQQGVKTVGGNPNAIGYVSIGTAEFSINEGVPIKLLPLDGVASTTKNVANGAFPLSRPLNLVTKEVPTGLTETFIKFAQSSQVYDIVKQQDFVPLSK